MNETRKFHLGAILSITTGFLMPTPGYKYPIDQVYEILDFMTSDNLQTVALPRGAQECRPYLFEQLPFTKDVSFEHMRGNKDIEMWELALDTLVSEHGEFHDVRPIHFEDHERLNPIDDIHRINPDFPTENVIHIDPDDLDMRTL